MRAVVARGLRDHRRTALTWGGSLGALTALIAAIWPSIQGSIDQLMRHYPPALKDAFGITELRSVEAYIDAEMLSIIIPFAVAVLGVRAITRIVTTPEEQGWLDTVLTAPVRRRTLAAGAFAVSAIVVGEVLTIITALTWVAGTLAGADPSLIVLARGMVNLWPLALLVAGLAALVAGRAHRSAPASRGRGCSTSIAGPAPLRSRRSPAAPPSRCSSIATPGRRLATSSGSGSESGSSW
jgi:ABC-2 type transport system permease protein